MEETSGSPPLIYQVYVMRIWQEEQDPAVWRFSLEDPSTGQRRGFSCLPEMVAYLERKTEHAVQNDQGNIERSE